MKDYSAIRGKAKRLIEKYGRQIELYRMEAGDPPATQPWKRPEPTKVSFLRVGVFVPPGAVRVFGLTALGDASEAKDVMNRVQQICILSPEGLDVQSITHVEDRDIVFGVIATQTLRPGASDLLAFLGLER